MRDEESPEGGHRFDRRPPPPDESSTGRRSEPVLAALLVEDDPGRVATGQQSRVEVLGIAIELAEDIGADLEVGVVPPASRSRERWLERSDVRTEREETVATHTLARAFRSRICGEDDRDGTPATVRSCSSELQHPISRPFHALPVGPPRIGAGEPSQRGIRDGDGRLTTLVASDIDDGGRQVGAAHAVPFDRGDLDGSAGARVGRHPTPHDSGGSTSSGVADHGVHALAPGEDEWQPVECRRTRTDDQRLMLGRRRPRAGPQHETVFEMQCPPSRAIDEDPGTESNERSVVDPGTDRPVAQSAVVQMPCRDQVDVHTESSLARQTRSSGVADPWMTTASDGL